MVFKRHEKPRNLQKKKRHLDYRDTRDRLIVSIVGALGQIYLLLAGNFFLEPGTPDYYHAHQSLLIVSTLVALAFIVSDSLISWNLGPIIRKALEDIGSMTLQEWRSLVWGVLFGLAVIGFMTVDMSFFKNYGMRISAVVGMALFRILRVALIRR